MKVQFYDNQYISSENAAIDIVSIVNDNDESTEMVIACDNEDVKQNLIDRIAEKYNRRSSFTALMMNEALDAATKVDDKRVKDCNISLILYHRGGALVLQVGDGRILQVRPHKKCDTYDSRDQVQDIYSSDAKIMEINNIENGDYFVISTISRFSGSKVVETLCNSTRGDVEKINTIETIIDNADAALLLQHVDTAEGTAGVALNDMGGKWKAVIALLAVAVIALATFNFVPKCDATKADDEQSTEQTSGNSAASEGASEVSRPSDAVTVDNNDASFDNANATTGEIKTGNPTTPATKPNAGTSLNSPAAKSDAEAAKASPAQGNDAKNTPSPAIAPKAEQKAPSTVPAAPVQQPAE